MFSKKSLSVKFALGVGAFGEDGNNSLTIDGGRMQAVIAKTGGLSNAQMQMRIWGMCLEDMTKLTVLNKLAFGQERDNSVIVSASDSGVVFSGTIKEAWVDPSIPDLGFTLNAFSGGFNSIRPVAPLSVKGVVSIDNLFSGIAMQMVPTHSFINSGVVGSLENPYIPGTLVQQAQALARAFNCNMSIDEGIIAIWPDGAARGESIVEVSANTGLMGSPKFTQNGIMFEVYYNPALTFGQKVRMKSEITAANGDWVVAAVSHELDAEVQGGAWRTTVECGLFGYSKPIL